MPKLTLHDLLLVGLRLRPPLVRTDEKARHARWRHHLRETSGAYLATALHDLPERTVRPLRHDREGVRVRRFGRHLC